MIDRLLELEGEEPVQPTEPKTPETLSELVSQYWDDLLAYGRITVNRLEELRAGTKPTPIEQVRLGAVIGDEDLVIDLSGKIQNGKSGKGRVKNGAGT